MAQPILKAPFPYFGGKTKIAATVWRLLGNPRNYVEPFCGSAAVLLSRPAPLGGSETVNDYSCLLVNAWRAIQADPEGLARRLVAPVSEVNTEAQHYALVSGEPPLRDLLGNPTAYDLEKAAWWIKGANEWIGSGWGSGDGPWAWSPDTGWLKRGNAGTGVNRQLPHLGNAGTGVNRQLPHLGDAGKGYYEQRAAWVSDWLGALRDRLAGVRIACGDWSRVLTPSVTLKHGVTAVFLDPPYRGTEYVYEQNQGVFNDVQRWCMENGADNRFRVVLAGRGDEHDALLGHGWQKLTWSSGRGYSGVGNDSRHTEAIWHNCVHTYDDVI